MEIDPAEVIVGFVRASLIFLGEDPNCAPDILMASLLRAQGNRPEHRKLDYSDWLIHYEGIARWFLEKRGYKVAQPGEEDLRL